jgi:hypothetical protein
MTLYERARHVRCRPRQRPDSSGCDDNNRVHKGDLLAQLDREPYQNAVAEKRAAVETAKADLLAEPRPQCVGLKHKPEAYVSN